MKLKFLNKKEIRRAKLDESFCYLKDEKDNLFKISKDVEKIELSKLENIKSIGLFIGKTTDIE